MYVFWYDYMKPQYGEKAKLCYVAVWQLYCLNKMLKQNLIFQIMNQIDHYLKKKRKSNWINEE